MEEINIKKVVDQLKDLKFDPNKDSIQLIINRVYTDSTRLYHENIEYREKKKEQTRLRYNNMTNEEKTKYLQRYKDKYANDPEYRKKALERSAKQREKKKKEKQSSNIKEVKKEDK